jgi:AraC family transcriptional regulator
MKATTRSDYEKRIARVIEAIEASSHTPPRLSELAALAHFSPFHFHRIYRAIRGEAVADTLRRARMRRAAFGLSSTRRKIVDIALEAGYESAQSFARAFKELVSVSPSEFRNSEWTFADCVAGPQFSSSFKEDQPMDVQIIEQAPFKAHALRHHGPIGSIPDTWKKLWKWAVDRELTKKGPQAVGVCSADPENEGNMRYFAALASADPLAPSGEVEVIDVAGGRYASYRHVGPYANIAAAFDRLFAGWLPESGYEPDDRPCLEMYRNNPYDTPANELITDLLIPVR